MTTPKNSTHCCVCSAEFTFKAPHLDEIEEQIVKYYRGWAFAKFPGIPVPTAVCGDRVREFVNPVGLMLQRAYLKGQQGRNNG